MKAVVKVVSSARFESASGVHRGTRRLLMMGRTILSVSAGDAERRDRNRPMAEMPAGEVRNSATPVRSPSKRGGHSSAPSSKGGSEQFF